MCELIVYNNKELDQKILDAILKFDGVPSTKALGRKLGISGPAITRRINENPDLWLAYYTKQGLTPDQAVELALERSKQKHQSKLLQEDYNIYMLTERWQG